MHSTMKKSTRSHWKNTSEADAWFIVYSLGVHAGAFDPNIAERGRLEAVTDLSAVARQSGAASASFDAAGDTSCVEQSSASVGVRLVTVLPANTFQALLTRSSDVPSRPWAESQAGFVP